MPTKYVLRINPGDGSQTDSDLSANGNALLNGTDELANEPGNMAPPTGMLAVYADASMTTVSKLIPYTPIGGTSFEEIANEVRLDFEEKIQNAKGLPTQYDNGPPLFADVGPWAYVAVEQSAGDTLQATGDGKSELSRMDGFLRIEMRDNLGKGDGLLLECIDDIDRAFRYLIDGSVRYQGPMLIHRARDRSAGSTHWWRIDVIVPFKVDRPDAV